MVLAMPWSADFDANDMRTTKAPIWIELPMINPVFEYYSNQFLAKTGIMIYAPTWQSKSKFPHIWGCILCNLNKDLIEYIVVKILGIGEKFKVDVGVDVSYSTLPNACIACKCWGHITRYCPSKPRPLPQAKVNTNAKDATEKGKKTIDTEGFEAIPTKKSTKDSRKQLVAPPDKAQNGKKFVALEEDPIEVSEETTEAQ